MKEIKLICLCLTILIAVPLTALSQDTYKRRRMDQQSNRLPSAKELEAEKETLLLIIRDKINRQNDLEKLFETIDRIGERKIVEAIPDLIELITLRQKLWREGTRTVLARPNTLRGNFPAMSALFSIRKPSLPALIKVIETNDAGSLASQNALETIWRIFANLKRTEDFLKDKIAESQTPEGRKRILEAIEKTAKMCGKIISCRDSI